VAKHVNVLVGNVLQVQKMQIPQGLQIRHGRSGILYSLEIEIQKVIRHGPQGIGNSPCPGPSKGRQ
jgi:hypothetical protein